MKDHHGPPETWVAHLIAREGGLPKVTAPLTHYEAQEAGIADTAQVYRVVGWEVQEVFLQTAQSIAEAVWRQEAGYSIGLQFRVRYADGDAAIFRWETWRYGFCLGPVALDMGGGPAGDLRLVSLQQ